MMKTPNRHLETALREAIMRRDIKRIGELVDAMRFWHRENYQECFKLASRLTGISLGEWDELLYEADQAEED